MTPVCNFFALLLILPLLWVGKDASVAFVSSYSTGAGGCLGGKPAVSSYHLSNTGGRVVKNQTLADSGISVFVGTTKVAPTNNSLAVFRFKVGTLYEVRVQAKKGTSFKGVLFRGDTPNRTTKIYDLTAGNGTQISKACNNLNIVTVSGITHKDSIPKTIAKGTLRVRNRSRMVLDVTVVFSNNESSSVYAYGNTTLSFVP